MASVILAGTPAVVEGSSVSGVTSVVAGSYIAVDSTNPEAPVVSWDLTVGDGLAVTGTGVQSLEVNLAAGTGVAIAPPVGVGDPITLGLNFSTAAAEFLMLQLNQDGTVNTAATNFVPAYTGWYVFQPSITMGIAGFNFPAGASIQFWIQQGATIDPNSLVCFTSAAAAPPAGLGALEDTRNAVVHLTAGLPYTPYFEWNGVGLNLGTPTSTVGGAAVYMVPLFA